MPILSPEFSLFFLLFFPCYWAFRAAPKIQNGLLLIANLSLLLYLNIGFAASVFFFSWLITVVSWHIQYSEERVRRFWLWFGVICALILLAFFKYFDFFRPKIYALGYTKVADMIMPLGLSYYVFQSVAYLVAIYQRKVPLFKWHELLLHFSFFLTITAGPIIRASRFKTINGSQLGFAEQLHQPRKLLNPSLAVTLILLGAAKTWCFSGQISLHFVEPVFDNPMQYSPVAILLAVYGYTLQLFFDFSGYSDLVIGLGLLLGFQLPQNFDAPLFARNLNEFWSRWHMTLSTWIRDYIYIPLGGSRRGFGRTQLNLLIAMLLSGIWHGNSWNFFIWGALHGLALVSFNIKRKLIGAPNEESWLYFLKQALAIFLTFNFVCFTFVIFKLTEFAEIKAVFHALISSEQRISSTEWDYIFLMYMGLACYPLLKALLHYFVRFLRCLPPPLWIILIVLFLQIIVTFSPAGIPGFIYADF